MNVTLQDQIAEVKRELALRERKYPEWVTSGRMKREQAARQINAMKAVLNTLEQQDAINRPELFPR